jgi:hypothetical protein
MSLEHNEATQFHKPFHRCTCHFTGRTGAEAISQATQFHRAFYRSRSFKGIAKTSRLPYTPELQISGSEVGGQQLCLAILFIQ